MRSRTSRNQRGAVAIIVAISSVLLLSLAAIAVDLGNAMVRKRDVQSQADFAALAGAAKLGISNTKSAAHPAVIAVAAYLTANQPQDDNPGNPPDITAAQLVDGGNAAYPAGSANGEVYFLPKSQMRVVSPPARVNFGLASVMGFNNADVRAEATVGLLSPGPVVPYFLPKDCASGRVELKASNYNPNAPTFNPPSSNGGSVAKITRVDPLTVPGAEPSTLSIFGTGFTGTLTADFFHEASGDRVPVDTTQGHFVTPVSAGVNRQDDKATTVLPPRVFNVPGKWYVRINNGSGYSRDAATFIVGNPIAPPVGCGVKSTGDFGVVDSPRALVTQLADASALNMAVGLDHDLALFGALLPPRVSDSCNGMGAIPFPGAIPDKVSQPDNNCVDVKNGMNTDTVTNGMITGGSTSQGSYTGRLVKDTTAGCDRNGQSNEATPISGYAINDDVLSCFLPSGVQVSKVSGATIANADEGIIDPGIFDSPRFMVVPVIDSALNPPNGFYPLVSFQPVFITDESPASEKGISYGTSKNGVIIQTSKVVGITVIAINPAALPETADSASGTIPFTGSGTKIIRLLN